MPEPTLEPLITECPNCRTRFRVSEAQLAKASGRVRCGACLSVFQATDRLVFGSATSLEPHAPERDLDKLLAELNRAGKAEGRQAERSGVSRAIVHRRVLGAVPVGQTGEATARSAARVPGGTRGTGVMTGLTERPAPESSERFATVVPEGPSVSDAGGQRVGTGTDPLRTSVPAESVQPGTLTESDGNPSIAEAGQRPATAPDRRIPGRRDRSVGTDSRASLDAAPVALTEAASPAGAAIAEHGRPSSPPRSDGETGVQHPSSRADVERRLAPVELSSTAASEEDATGEVTSAEALVREDVRVQESAPAHLAKLGPGADVFGPPREGIGHEREARAHEHPVRLPNDDTPDVREVETIELSMMSSTVPESDASPSAAPDAYAAASSLVRVLDSPVVDSPGLDAQASERGIDSRRNDVRVPNSRDRRGDRRASTHDSEFGDDDLRASAAPLASSIEADLRIERPSGRRWWMLVAIVAAAAALVGQVFWFQFDEWSRDLRFRPIYQEICARVGCRLPVMRALESIQSRNLVVRSHPNVAGALLVDALIINDAAFPQPFPLIELRFSSLTGSLVAGRRFKPSEYLSGELAGAEMMQPNTPVHIALEIDDPGTEAVNYVMVFR